MEIKAIARFVRMSPRKVRLVINLIRGMRVAQAQTQLKFMNKAATTPVLKLLNSAIANAEHNFELDGSNLYIKSITADGGPVLKRWTPKAFGKATPIRKPTVHISIVLEEKGAEPVKPSTKEVKTDKKVSLKKAQVK